MEKLSKKAKRRLGKLSALLRKDAKRKNGVRFDIHDFGTISNHKKPLSCGTTACALGLAALSEEFKHQGLGYEISGTNIRILYKGDDLSEYYTASKVFDISEGLATFLFSGSANEEFNSGADAENELAAIIDQVLKGEDPFNYEGEQ